MSWKTRFVWFKTLNELEALGTLMILEAVQDMRSGMVTLSFITDKAERVGFRTTQKVAERIIKGADSNMFVDVKKCLSV